MASSKGTERRRSRRVPLQNVIVEISPPSQQGRKFTGIIRDISLGGMLIGFETQPPKPDYVHVTFILPSGGVLSYIRADVRRETVDQEGNYALGIEFTGLGDEDQLKLDRFFKTYDGYYQ